MQKKITKFAYQLKIFMQMQVFLGIIYAIPVP